MYRNVSCAGFDYEITSVRLKKLEIFVYIFLQNLEGLNMSRTGRTEIQAHLD